MAAITGIITVTKCGHYQWGGVDVLLTQYSGCFALVNQMGHCPPAVYLLAQKRRLGETAGDSD